MHAIHYVMAASSAAEPCAANRPSLRAVGDSYDHIPCGCGAGVRAITHRASRRLLALALSRWLATVALLASHSRARQQEDLETFIQTNQRLRIVGPGP